MSIYSEGYACGQGYESARQEGNKESMIKFQKELKSNKALPSFEDGFRDGIDDMKEMSFYNEAM